MLPLVGIATSLLPELIKLIAGDKAGTIATDVAKAVETATGTSDPAEAKQKLAADPAVTSDLQIKLAQIAIDATKAQNAELDQKRQDELAELKARLGDVENARTSLAALATAKSPLAWVAPSVSLATMGGFFAILLILMIVISRHGDDIADNQLINICIGALVAAFSTVVNFWLGSSKGSQDKDVANLKIQTANTAQTNDFIKTQAEQTKVALKAATSGGGGTPSPTSGSAGTDAADNFDQCLAVTLVQEGGFSNDPHDPGGATNFGITIADYKEFKGTDVTPEDVKNMTKEEAVEIYRTKYWNPMRCAEMPKGVDLAVFDFGVNSGNSRSIKFLQQILGVTADGSLGPITMAAVNASDPHGLVQQLCARRLAFLQGLKTFEFFGKGWTRRVNEVEQAAMKMVG